MAKKMGPGIAVILALFSSEALGASAVMVGRPRSEAVLPAAIYGVGDATAEYQRRWAAAPADFSRQLPSVRRHKVVLITGSFSSAWTPLKSSKLVSRWVKFARHFSEQAAWLDSVGVDFERIPVAGLPPEENAAVVAQALERSPRPVILLTHSKGGLDAQEALRARPDLRGRVAGWIALQGPFAGTPIIDDIYRNEMLAKWAGRILGGSEIVTRALASMGTSARMDYNRRHWVELERLLESMPILSVTSWHGRQIENWHRVLRWTGRWVGRKGDANDGLVPCESAASFARETVVLGGVDHLSTVTDNQTSPFDRVRFTQTLLTMLLDRAR